MTGRSALHPPHSPYSPGVFRILNYETPRWANWLAPVVIPTARGLTPRLSLPSPLTCKQWRRGSASNDRPLLFLTQPGFSPITFSSLLSNASRPRRLASASARRLLRAAKLPLRSRLRSKLEACVPNDASIAESNEKRNSQTANKDRN